MTRSRITIVVVLVALGLAAHASAEEPTYDEALEFYKTRIGDAALKSRTEGRERLAETRDPRAYKILRNSYAKPEQPKNPVRYLIAQVAGGEFVDAAFVDSWSEWMGKHRKREDAWLWFQGCVARLRGGAPVETAALDSQHDIFLRAAAIEALARGLEIELIAAKSERRDPVLERDILARMDGELGSLPSGFDRGVVLGSLASLALALKPHLESADVRGPVGRLVRHIGAKETPAWASLAIARRISRLVDAPHVTLHVRSLLAAINGEGLKSEDADRYGRPDFMGLEATGTRISYVIDCSDSMLGPLTSKEKEALRRPAVTGSDESKKRPADEIDWSKVKTRFDVAREYLKLSLRGLSKDQAFAVVCIGSQPEFLKGMGAMKAATSGRVKKAVAALDRIKVLSSTPERPHGRLMGDTNFHSAVRAAFHVGAKGASLKEPAYVAKRRFDDGCDTMFIFSDGQPTMDDYPGKGHALTSGPGTYDRETGKRTGGDGPVRLSSDVELEGPYAESGWYLQGDVRRMNLFRKVEIHCVGIGEANRWFLKQIAGMGLGTVRMVGKGR